MRPIKSEVNTVVGLAAAWRVRRWMDGARFPMPTARWRRYVGVWAKIAWLREPEAQAPGETS